MACTSALFRPFSAPLRATLLPVGPAFQTSNCLASRASVRHASHRGFRRPRPRYNRFGAAEKVYTLWYTRPGFRYGLGGLGLGGGYFYYHNLETVPITGRRRFNCVSPTMEKKLVAGGYEEVVRAYGSHILPDNHPYTKLVRRVMERLIPVSGLESEPWEVKVIDDPSQKNAFVMPG